MSFPAMQSCCSTLLLPVLLLSFGATAPDDTGALKKIVAALSAAKGPIDPQQKGFGPDLRRQLDGLTAQIADKELRSQVQKLLADLEPNYAVQLRCQFVISEVKRLKGKTITEPAGPDWLTKLVGADAMGFFARLTEIELNEHTDGHADKKPRPKGEAVSDDWLKNLDGLPDLVRLELSGTAISDTGLVSLKNLKNLERLNICLTPVTDAGIVHLAGLTKLKRLVICSTKVTGSGFKKVPNWPSIESINLHSCPVSDEGLAAISRFGNLQRLEIVHSKVTDAGLAHLGKLTNLRQLHVASHGVTKNGLAFVDRLTRLYQLDLYEELASNEGVAMAGKLPNLKILNLYSGPVDDAGLASLRGLTSLEELTLGGLGKVTDAAVEHVIVLKSLKTVRINGTKISEAGLKQIRLALPQAQVSK